MANIRLNPDQLDSRAAEYSTQGNTLSQLIQKMDSLNNQLQSEWEGDSQKKFEETYKELKPGFQKAVELIDDLSKSLKATAQRMRDADQAGR